MSLLKSAIEQSLEQYFHALEDGVANNLHRLMLSEIEPTLISCVLARTKGNQTKTAQWLGLSRGTLRKLIEKYRL